MLTFRAPAYVGVGGLGGAVVSAFLQAVTRPLAAPLLGLPRAARTLPLPDRRFRAASPWDLLITGSTAGLLKPTPPLGRLGCLPAHHQLRPGGDRRGLRWPRAAA